jgi:hypothetical protein
MQVEQVLRVLIQITHRVVVAVLVRLAEQQVQQPNQEVVVMV